MEIGNRQKIPLTIFYPSFAFGILALWAMTVTAAVVAYADVPAGVAPVHVTAKGCGTTISDRIQGSQNVPVGLMFFFKLSAKPFNDLCQFRRIPCDSGTYRSLLYLLCRMWIIIRPESMSAIRRRLASWARSPAE